jgi:hypothetical protein
LDEWTLVVAGSADLDDEAVDTVDEEMARSRLYTRTGSSLGRIL